MIEKIVKRGYHSKHKELVTIVELQVGFGEVHVFYIDTNYNTVKPYHKIKSIINHNDLTQDNFNETFVCDIFGQIDEDAFSNDYICKCLVLAWMCPTGEIIICKSGDGINIDVLTSGWDEITKKRVCHLPNQSEKFFYIGSGASIKLTHKTYDDEAIILYTDDTQFYLNNKSKEEFFDYMQEYKQQINEMNFPKMLDDLNYDYMLSKGSPSKDLFIAAIFNSQFK